MHFTRRYPEFVGPSFLPLVHFLNHESDVVKKVVNSGKPSTTAQIVLSARDDKDHPGLVPNQTHQSPKQPSPPSLDHAQGKRRILLMLGRPLDSCIVGPHLSDNRARRNNSHSHEMSRRHGPHVHPRLLLLDDGLPRQMKYTYHQHRHRRHHHHHCCWQQQYCYW